MPDTLAAGTLSDRTTVPGTVVPGTFFDGAPAAADGDTIVVGALEQYEARCRSCHQLAAPALALG